ncbi:ATP-dependent helicase [Sphaerisporangium sp. NPDC051017]|uniref:ATP-dependent helicase n=1 Tax=Sphaerisporangium sp. NPDC051017 TaxID=3154636 RepID=UPI003424BE38
MTGPFEDTPELTAEQKEVVRLPDDARALVIAGAGAGKTYTLVRRLDTLVERDQLSAGDLLVLSFSRAAVRELKERLARHGEASRHVRVQTFDSWALELLLEMDPEGDWRSRAFDERIEAAADVIERYGLDELYDDLRHVVIDEVQDLVGSRRDLVETLLDTQNCGFTVVGDPAQAIYGFQVPEAERTGENGRFFDWLRSRFGDELVELRLTRNFRARTEEAEIALAFGPALQAGTARSAEKLYRALRNSLQETLLMGDLEDPFVHESLRDHEGTTAILCRTNGQALLVSGQLRAGGVDHRLQRSARDRVVPAWLSLLFRAIDGSMLSQSRFLEVVGDQAMLDEADHSRLWNMLLRTGRGRGRALDLARLRTAIINGGLPDELTAQPTAQLIVSSVHRAKGLEFDRVIVVDPGPLREEGGRSVDIGEEARTLYVALTRARQELMHLNSPRTVPSYVRKVGRQERWGVYHMGKKSLRLGVELIAGDVDTVEPPGSPGDLPGVRYEHTALDLQDLLLDKVRSGDEVMLGRIDGEPADADRSPRYTVTLKDNGCPIGITSESFSRDLYDYMRIFRNHAPSSWPRTISGLAIDTIETVAGSVSAGSLSGLGSHGVWAAPRLFGLGRFTYDEASAKEGDRA